LLRYEKPFISEKVKILIGIDDTDNLESRGTGFRARQLGQLLSESGLAEIFDVTRHQLLVDDRIPYTSHNSSASIFCEQKGKRLEIINFCRDFLIKESAEGSDAGLCIATIKQIDNDVIEWGKRAKKEVLNENEAILLSQQKKIHLEGICGEKTGIIGALAAVGLRAEGNDGRLLWLPGLREIKGLHTVTVLKKSYRIDHVSDIQGNEINDNEFIEIGEFCRPVHRENKITLLVENIATNGKIIRKTASKEFIKSISG
jgi:hypothetical protein